MATAENKHMRSIPANNVRFFYETDDSGNKILRHILVGSARNILQMPADGITIDTVPPDSVGSGEIKDGSIQSEDLAPEIITTPQEARDIVAAAIARETGE